MVIECVGVAGSGKSMLVSHLEKQHGVQTVPMYVSRYYSLVFLFRHPLLTLQWMNALVWECHATNTWRLFRFKLSVFSTTVGRMAYARMNYRTSDVVVLDEGMMQRLISLFESTISQEVALKWVRRMMVSDAVILAHLPEGTTERKIGTCRKRAFSVAYQMQWLEVIDHNAQMLFTALEHARTDTCTYNWSETKAVERVYECIKRRR